MMKQGATRSTQCAQAVRFIVCALLLVVLAGPAASRAATPATHLNGAGLVIKHGDGRVLYFYIQFSEPQITGEQLLERSGVQLDETPYSSLGVGICRIDGEGCPSTDCFCKSYAVPSVYWRYYSLNSVGSWVYRVTGPAGRVVHDGDVDGWSWSGADNDLPATSIDAIAQLNGVTRTPDAPQPTPTSAPAVTPGPTAPPTPTAAPIVTLGPTLPPTPATRPAVTPTATTPATAPPTPTAAPAVTATATSLVTPLPSPITTQAATALAPAARPSVAASSATAVPLVLGVSVNQSGQKTPIEPVASHASRSWRTYVWFGVTILALIVIATIVFVRRRGASVP